MDFDKDDIDKKELCNILLKDKNFIENFSGEKNLSAIQDVNIYIRDIYTSHFKQVEDKIDDAMSDLANLRKETSELVKKMKNIPFDSNASVQLHAFYNKVDECLIDSRKYMKKAHRFANEVYDKTFYGDGQDSLVGVLYAAPKGGAGGGKEKTLGINLDKLIESREV